MYVDRIYPTGPDIKDTIDTDMSSANIQTLTTIDSNSRLRAKLYDIRDHFNLTIS